MEFQKGQINYGAFELKNSVDRQSEIAEFFLDKGELLLTLYPKKAIRDDIIHTIYNDAGYDVKIINRKTL